MGAARSRQDEGQQASSNGDCQACQEASSNKSAPSAGRPLRPPSRAEIGRASWRYVHAMAAQYPESPVPKEQANALAWLRAFVRLYPCHICSQEFIAVCSDLPPRLGSCDEYSMWWCEAHNRVRDDLSQSLFRCDSKELLALGRAGKILGEGSAPIPGT
eukprot:TRINITY_DN11510_c0_g1_i1.p1 TRINITY_DN11510_c0_g1~~TRINITY_DN11510_c0_g1_i1.p1  ORF type:complete len:159 (+),score=27.23 TRINITY_DN11510_c0_g1_i1:155-631(+)